MLTLLLLACATGGDSSDKTGTEKVYKLSISK